MDTSNHNESEEVAIIDCSTNNDRTNGITNAAFDSGGEVGRVLQPSLDYEIATTCQKVGGSTTVLDETLQDTSTGTNYNGSIVENVPDDDSDIISDYIGHYGRWQFLWTFLLCLFQIPTTFHFFCLVFQAANREHWCARPAHLRTLPLELWRNLTQPDGGRCSLVNAPYRQLNVLNFTDYFLTVNVSSLERISCSGYEFDSNVFGSTIISEFGLVCDKDHLNSIVEMCYLVGAALGSVGSGWISDQFGRRHTFMAFAIIQTSAGFFIGLVSSLEMFMIARVVIGITSMSVTVVGFVLVVELVSGKPRTIIGILNILPVAISYTLTAGIAFYTREWRLMQFIITTPGAVLLPIWYWLPESPRWLLAKGRIEELKRLIDTAAKMNGRKLPLNYERTLNIPNSECSKEVVSILDIFHKRFIHTTLTMLVIWFAIIVLYCGITLHVGQLGGDIYLNTVLAGAVESITICLSIFAVLKLGLWVNLFLYMTVAGLSCIVMNLVPDGNLWVIIMLAMTAKCATGTCNAIISTFTARYYPTTMRNLGVGAGNFAAGIALIVVPYVWLLERTYKYLPLTVMGMCSLLGAVSLLILKDKRPVRQKSEHKTSSSVIKAPGDHIG
ncbi:organic cation transporter protein-like [Sabethes cyaneus]|uniref:organic cation transporter protein-like n=1 Tax=Sabethes cyaneus TaxID=53552 RepID=UPI00237E835D|nr:organic cation transporter protein-like [Sabethes cyaneus]